MTELDMLLQTTPEAIPVMLQPQAIRELQDEVMRLRRYLKDCEKELRDHKEECIRLRGGKEIKALTEEVDRLKNDLVMAVQVSGQLCEKCGWAMKFSEEPCRCELLAEVERLTTERDAVAKKAVQEWKDANGYDDLLAAYSATISQRNAAFKRGVAAMREAARTGFVDEAKKWQREGDGEMELRYLRLVGDIRAIPDPEDTP